MQLQQPEELQQVVKSRLNWKLHKHPFNKSLMNKRFPQDLIQNFCGCHFDYCHCYSQLKLTTTWKEIKMLLRTQRKTTAPSRKWKLLIRSIPEICQLADGINGLWFFPTGSSELKDLFSCQIWPHSRLQFQEMSNLSS